MQVTSNPYGKEEINNDLDNIFKELLLDDFSADLDLDFAVDFNGTLEKNDTDFLNHFKDGFMEGNHSNLNSYLLQIVLENFLLEL